MSHGGMFFHTNVMNTILFEKWHTMTWEELLGSCIGIAIIAALYEGLKVGRDFVDLRLASKASKEAAHQHHYQQQQQQQPACECNATDESSMKTSTAGSTVIAIGEDHDTKKKKNNRPDIISLRHIIQTGLHFVQLWIGFCLMLVFMTFSVYLCLAITIGGAIGYFCFAWLRPRTHFDYSSSYSSDCCN